MTVQDTPILRLFRQIRTQNAEAVAKVRSGEIDDEAPVWDRLDKMEAELLAMPCTGIGDFAAKAILDTAEGGVFCDWKTGALWKEARALVGEEKAA